MVGTAAYRNGDWRYTATDYDADGNAAKSWDERGIEGILAEGDTDADAFDSYATVTAYNTADITSTAADGSGRYEQCRGWTTALAGHGHDHQDTVTVLRHYDDTGDNPAWATSTTGSAAAVTSVYGSSIGRGLGLTSTGGVAPLALAGPHGDTVTTVTVPTEGSVPQLGAVACYDEYGNALTDLNQTAVDADGDPVDTTTELDTGALSYGWLGAKQRATDGSGLVLMGARLYNSATGRFTSVDPVPAATPPPTPTRKTSSTSSTSTGSGVFHGATSGGRYTNTEGGLPRRLPRGAVSSLQLGGHLARYSRLERSPFGARSELRKVADGARRPQPI